jgi:equilibrative nucleoside transporter 1/2/3
LWFWSVVRLAFLPLFLLCNVERTAFPVVFASDAFPIGFMLLFALSNGYISSLSMMWGPRNAPPALAEQAGTVMIFLLTAGLSAGSGFSFLVTGISSGFKGGDC